jgi:hypothetical protein
MVWPSDCFSHFKGKRGFGGKAPNQQGGARCEALRAFLNQKLFPHRDRRTSVLTLNRLTLKEIWRRYPYIQQAKI